MDSKSITTRLAGRILRQDPDLGLSTVQIEDGELRLPEVDGPVGATVDVAVDARDVSLALSRPMDVSITNRLPGRIVTIEELARPYACVMVDLGHVHLASLVTVESVARLGLEPGLPVWAMIKAVAIGPEAISPAPSPRPWPRR